VIEYHGRKVNSIKTGFRRACKEAGIEDCSPHVLRHTSASHMMMERVPTIIIARILGDTVAMVERVYGHHHPDFLAEGVDALVGPIGPRQREERK
jgi:integrase